MYLLLLCMPIEISVSFLFCNLHYLNVFSYLYFVIDHFDSKWTITYKHYLASELYRVAHKKTERHTFDITWIP